VIGQSEADLAPKLWGLHGPRGRVGTTSIPHMIQENWRSVQKLGPGLPAWPGPKTATDRSTHVRGVVEIFPVPLDQFLDAMLQPVFYGNS